MEKWRSVGSSRQGRPIFGGVIGKGPIRVSITAGAHADEPVGPLSALEIIRHLTTTEEGGLLLEQTTWHICPMVNPDGSAVNAEWFRDPMDLKIYLKNVRREEPGEDVEFNYPSVVHQRKPRPENMAVAGFLRGGGRYHMHVSLHGMAFATGAWWLIGEDWVERTAALRARLRDFFRRYELGLHDMDRGGEKGFTRIEEGFSTTPTATAMRQFFNKHDAEQAELFLPSSMEFVQSLGGNPLVMVSELPLFRIHRHDFSLSGEGSFFDTFRPRMAEAKGALIEGHDGLLKELVEEYDIRPVPLAAQIEAIRASVIQSITVIPR